MRRREFITLIGGAAVLDLLYEVANEQDYNDGTQNEHPIGNLSARYRCFPAKPFHDFPSQVGRLSWRPFLFYPLLMLWTAPPPARKCHECGVLLRPPRFRGANHASNYDNRSRYR